MKSFKIIKGIVLLKISALFLNTFKTCSILYREKVRWYQNVDGIKTIFIYTNKRRALQTISVLNLPYLEDDSFYQRIK
jgi:hypothetical protein